MGTGSTRTFSEEWLALREAAPTASTMHPWEPVDPHATTALRAADGRLNASAKPQLRAIAHGGVVAMDESADARRARADGAGKKCVPERVKGLRNGAEWCRITN